MLFRFEKVNPNSKHSGTPFAAAVSHLCYDPVTGTIRTVFERASSEFGSAGLALVPLRNLPFPLQDGPGGQVRWVPPLAPPSITS
jgi:hypothetical protein